MSPQEEQRVIDLVCAALEKRALKTKDLVRELATAKVDITKKELNQLLYRRMSAVAGLSVQDFVWTFGNASIPAAEKGSKTRSAAIVTVAARRVVAPPPVRTLDFAPDPEQAAVIALAPSARVFVEAGPGTGKTAIACRRIARMLLEENVNPANVLVISFTRTAVAEFRNRIAHYVPRASATQVQVSTIDSSAWQFESVYGEGATRLNGFDETVESALTLLRKKDASLADLLASLEHVVVDEAQDVTGIRSDFVIELVRSLPKQCGATIFADSLQSIYGFTLLAGDDESEREDVGIDSPLERLKAGLPSFEQMRLSKPHRFSEELSEVLAEARAIVGNGDLDSREKQRQLSEGISTAAEELPHDYGPICQLLRDEASALLLFRYRREVVQASAFLLSNGICHRLRMPQLPECIQPWIARVFWDYTQPTIDRGTFETLYSTRCEPRASHEPTGESAWETLRRLAPETRERVRVGALRTVLARVRPPIEACYLDTGPTGPTLGTIHASKGREAESVYVFIPELVTEGDIEEESRVLYVAATRARSRLLATNAFKADAKRLHKHGRCFRLEKSQRGRIGKMEVGLSGDLHSVTSVSTRIHETLNAAQNAQQTLWTNRNALAPLLARRTQNGAHYRLSLSREDENDECEVLGSLSVRVFEDAKSVAKLVGSAALPAWDLQFLYLTGARTHVTSADDGAELEHAHEPYRTTGFLLVPNVRGYCRFYINNTRK